jgi:hypothetical protein
MHWSAINATYRVKMQHVIEKCVSGDDNFIISLLTNHRHTISINAHKDYAMIIKKHVAVTQNVEILPLAITVYIECSCQQFLQF